MKWKAPPELKFLANPGIYPEVKDPAIDLIYFTADDQEAATHWQPMWEMTTYRS